MENHETASRLRSANANTAERTGLAQLYSSRMAPTSNWSDMGGTEHFVQFYDEDIHAVNSIAEYVIHGIKAGEVCMVVASAEHLFQIETVIDSFTAGLAAAKSNGRYIPMDAAETLSMFMRDELPDAKLFEATVGVNIAKAVNSGNRVRIYGEMVGLLCGQGNFAGAIRLEEIWNDLKDRHSFSLFCGYPMNVLDNAAASKHMPLICAAHTRVIPDETYTSLTSSDERLREIAMLQQRSKQLEAEVAELERRISLSQFQSKASRTL